MAMEYDRFSNDVAHVCRVGATLNPLYGNCSICPKRLECKKLNQEYIKAAEDTQAWCKRCIEENSPYAKYITFNEKKHCYECDFEMVELEIKSELEPEKLTAFEKLRLKNARRKQNQTSVLKQFFKKLFG